jgi:5-methylcytosine-specific restriction endonuclease McrA
VTPSEVKICPKCGSNNVEIGEATPPHAGSLRCLDCRHHRWLPKPDREKRRRSSSLALARKYGRGVCELCRRSATEIPAPECLEGHHLIAVDDDGDDSRENVIVVCSSCHSLVHHQQTYLGHYRQEKA